MVVTFLVRLAASMRPHAARPPWGRSWGRPRGRPGSILPCHERGRSESGHGFGSPRREPSGHDQLLQCRRCVVISVQPLSGSAAAEYYLDRDAGCEADYYLDRAEESGRWIGRGAAALGLDGQLGAEGEKAFRELLGGRHPYMGDVIARPVWRAHPAGRLPGKPLVDAVHQLARERGTSTAFVLADDRTTAAFAALESAVRRRPGMTSLDPRVAGRITNAVGLDPVEIFRTADGSDAYTPALARA